MPKPNSEVLSVRCKNGTRKNAKTNKCEPKTKNTKDKGTQKRTTKVRPLEKLTLLESDVNELVHIYKSYLKGDTIADFSGHLQKTYYKPRFSSQYYPKGEDLKELKQQIRENTPTTITNTAEKQLYLYRKLLERQIMSLMIAYSVGQYKLKDFSSSRVKY